MTRLTNYSNKNSPEIVDSEQTDKVFKDKESKQCWYTLVPSMAAESAVLQRDGNGYTLVFWGSAGY